MDVVNQATGLNTIAVEEVATLAVTLKNTSGNAYSLSAGDTMVVRMPSYFSEDDLNNMNIAYQGWAFTNDGSKLTLTLSAAYTWKAGAELSFAITNVKSSSNPPFNQQSYPGTVNLTLNDPDFPSPIVNSANFALVWANSEATLKWSVTLNPKDFTLDGDASGSTVAYAQPGNQIMPLTTVISTDSSQTPWVLGYVFNYNTAVPDKVIPQVCAVWWKQDSIKASNNVFYGNLVSDSGDTSTCYYANVPSTGDSIAIIVTFGSSTGSPMRSRRG